MYIYRKRKKFPGKIQGRKQKKIKFLKKLIIKKRKVYAGLNRAKSPIFILIKIEKIGLAASLRAKRVSEIKLINYKYG